jgi:CheY-like chemotaxis protein
MSTTNSTFRRGEAMSHRDQRPSRNAGVMPARTCILIVDHDRGASLALSFMLGVSGYEDVRAVRSAARALILAEQFRPAIVFVDIQMPDDGAFVLAAELRRGSQRRALRLIALTTLVEHPAREAARSAGFERFLVKPATQAELDSCLGSLPRPPE